MENNETEQTSVDVSQDSPSTESSETTSSKENVEASPKAPEKYVPYDRFNEVINQRNEREKAYAEQAKQIAELRDQLVKLSTPKETPKENKLVSELKQVHPEFAKWVEEQDLTRKELSDLRQWKQQYEAQASQREVMGALDKLHADHKVSADTQQIYNALLKARADALEASGAKLGIKDLPNLYKEVHESLNKLGRSNLTSYTAAKKPDAAIPSPKKGEAAKPATKKVQFSKDKETARSQIVKAALEQFRAHKNEL